MNNANAETRQQRRYRARQEKKGIAQPQKGAFKRAMHMAKQVAEAVRASMNLGPIALKLAMMDLAFRLGDYKSRGHGRGAPARNHLRPTNSRKPHQSGQEALRRALGGWASVKRYTGMTKNQAFQLLAPHNRIPLERAIRMLQGVEKAGWGRI